MTGAKGKTLSKNIREKTLFGRFCFPDWKNDILMFVYFPGYGIQMSTIDPEFLIKGSPLGKEGRGWFDAVLSMNIMEKLPTPSIECKAEDHKNIEDLKRIHEHHENCVLGNLAQNWSKRNMNCYPYILESYEHKM